MVNINSLPVIKDSRGVLTVAEKDVIPFEVKRVYFLSQMQKDLPRGFHAHYELRQVMICVQGSLDVLLDDGATRDVVKLNAGESILIDKIIWHEMSNFSQDCVISVLASDIYKESDYIRDYEQFKKFVKKS